MSNHQLNLNRRQFVIRSGLIGSMALFPFVAQSRLYPIGGHVLKVDEISGLQQIEGPRYLKHANWYAADQPGSGFTYRFRRGFLEQMRYLTTDLLVDGNDLVQFNITLQEGEDGPTFQFAFGALTQCQLRMRLPLDAVDQNTWRLPREGAFLKPMCWGDRVDLAKVDRMRWYINRKSEGRVAFCTTPMVATDEEVEVVSHPLLPKGKLLDDLGQSTLHTWPGKTPDQKTMMANLRNRANREDAIWPANFSKWGGDATNKLRDGTGFFKVQRHEDRWWLVDPDGFAFWSAGIDSVRVDTSANVHLLEDALTFLPEKEGEYSGVFARIDGQLHVNYLAANFIRAFGTEDWHQTWGRLALDELRRLRFNTVGNWSEWHFASRERFPYVRPMQFSPERTDLIYRDFPDVFHPDFSIDAQRYAETLADTRDDPALIGYFMMNEPTWAFSSELPAVGMMYHGQTCATRERLAGYLKDKYGSESELSQAWQIPVTFAELKQGKWTQSFKEQALVDLEAFSEIMVEHYFSTLAHACRTVDPNHLNLGIRYAGVPPVWAVRGMRSFDVFSMNNYREKVPFAETEEIHELLQMPVMIGEWHFGALDVGLPASGIGHVRTQADRGKAYRVYLEDAAANPYCVGTHWFVLYDQSALGRFDGENYNIGFFDVCHQPHEPLCNAAMASHERLYEVAKGKISPYQDEPEYLPKLYL